MLDTSTFQLVARPDDDFEEETVRLAALARDARVFVQSHEWAPPIEDLLLAFGIGGVIGLYLVRFKHGVLSGEGNGDREIWVVVGDLPSIYFEVEGSETPAAALETYCRIAQAWADAVLARGDLSDEFPIPIAPTEAHSHMLSSRLQTIRETFVPRLTRT